MPCQILFNSLVRAKHIGLWNKQKEEEKAL